jgi:hypothetical protein
LQNAKLFRKFIEEKIIFLNNEIKSSRKTKLFVSIIDYIYNIFDVRNNIKIENKESFLKSFEDFRKYFGGDKWTMWRDTKRFDLNYKIFIYSIDWDRFDESLLRKIEGKLNERYLLLVNLTNFYNDDKKIPVLI